MKLTPQDICGMDNKMKENRRSKSVDGKNCHDSDDDLDEGDNQGYNPNWTLRKCVSKILDRFSNIFPKLTIEGIKCFLETDIQSQDWLIK